MRSPPTARPTAAAVRPAGWLGKNPTRTRARDTTGVVRARTLEKAREKISVTGSSVERGRARLGEDARARIIDRFSYALARARCATKFLKHASAGDARRRGVRGDERR